SIGFKKSLIIGHMVVHAIKRRLESFNLKSPPLVTLPKIDGPIHGLHPPISKPIATMVKHEMGGSRIIEAVKKTDSSRGLLLGIAPINEGRNPPQQVPRIIL